MQRSAADLTDGGTLQTLAQAGATRACQALGQMLSTTLHVTSSSANPLDPHAHARLTEEAASSGARIGHLGIDGPPDGQAWVVIPSSSVEHLCETFGVPTGPDIEMRESLVAEVVNVVTGSYLTELGDSWGHVLDLSPVELRHDGDSAVFPQLPEPVEDIESVVFGCSIADSDGHSTMDLYLLLQQRREG